jgi:2-polyprenyl-6-hydroxyphenyl methylase/3-demethylubiquinone-9 3-methyltransferase
MKRIFKDSTWKESWIYSYPYDLLEIYGDIRSNIGYAYAYENRRNETLSLINSIANQGDSILDVAAAQGNFSLTLAELGYKVTWNDLRTELADYVKLKYERGDIEFKSGNVFDINFDHLFDIVLATEIIEHCAHPDDFLLRLSKLVKPHGYIVISTPLGSYFRNRLPKFTECEDTSQFEKIQFKPNSDGHIFLFHLDEILLLADKANLEIVKMKYFTNPLTHGHVKLNKVLRFLPKKMVFTFENLTQKMPKCIGKRICSEIVVLLQKKS